MSEADHSIRPDERDRHLVVVLGTNGMGKSWLTDLAKREWRKNNPNAPIFVLSKRQRNAFWVAGADENKKLLYPWVRRLTNNGIGPTDPPTPGQLVGLEGAFVELDDAENAIPPMTMSTPWHCLWTENRHLRLDVFLTAHRPQDISKTAIGCAHHLYLFAMDEPYAFDYLSDLPSLRSSNLMFDNPPESRGECIHVIKDPSRPGSARAERLNFYRAA